MIEAGAVYKHYKKETEYRIVCVAKHSETLEDLVIYEALYNNPMSKFWARPLAMFEELVEWPVGSGKNVPRFQKK